MKQVTLAALLLSISSLSIAASMSSMSKSEVTEALNDKTITTISAATLNDKVLANPFTGYFGKDGKMNGKFVQPTKDVPQKDQGTWLVKDDGSVCMTWTQWFKGKEECVYFFKLQNGLLIVGADQNFESFILSAHIKPGNQTKTTVQTQND
ncbi:Uncharacterised protein [Legionella wadsworthii]|uniref:Uncharacterized protein n=1 Tax=Legionella wadsworthii TaxID=28088 RepID=A0A378LST4_9GAMM|nr:hypothetical protein [Legionella wadsworthii]STY29843.1 Uncharacterised protein [Legionella wadsworthii]